MVDVVCAEDRSHELLHDVVVFVGGLRRTQTRQRVSTIFILAICISAGDVVNRLFFGAGVKLPGFLTAMMVGIIITNLADLLTMEVRQHDFD